ncbi:MAG: GMC family oxidoreductase [Planctomycetes bacterium]|nr:GMC family oxidoreductase [Planctomycetota bacterium]
MKNSNSPRFDAVVVGAGLTGGWAAKVLTEAGLHTAVLDAGPELTEEDFRIKTSVTTIFSLRSQLIFRLKEYLRGNRIASRGKFIFPETAKLALNERQYPYLTPRGYKFEWHRLRAIGGRGHVWGRVALRATDRDLFKAPEYAETGLWPISESDISREYAEIESFMKLAGSQSGCSEVPDGVYKEHRPLLGTALEFKRAVEKSYPGRRVVANHILTYPHTPVPNTIIAAQSTGNLKILSNTTVVNIEIDTVTGTATGVRTTDTTSGAEKIVKADFIVLSASPFETVRLMLNSRNSHHPEGIGDSRGQLGRYILEHVHMAFTTRLSAEIVESSGFTVNPFNLGDVKGTFYIPDFSQGSRQGFSLGYCLQGALIPDTGIGYLGTFGSTMPSKERRATLDFQRRDKLGVPILRIDFRWTAEDEQMVNHMRQSLRQFADVIDRELCQGADKTIAATLHNYEWFKKMPVPGSAIHECGGARMGTSPEDSVVNKYGRVWSAPNIVVCDASCFRSIPIVNPSLTAMAIAVRNCNHIAKVARRKADLVRL